LLILVSGATATHRRFADSRHFGHLVTPRGGHKMGPIIAAGKPWACDNDAFSGFDPAAFRKMLGRIAGLPGCLFVSCPDVVCKPCATLARFKGWSPEVAAIGQPVAFVGQDGCEDMESFSAWSNLYFPKGIAWIESLERQPTLWGDDPTS
jgi:hypothetical protein